MMRSCVFILVLGLVSPMAFGQTAVRDLPPAYGAGVWSFTVSIAISPPPGVAAAGFEDRPPAGWPISNISNGGALDGQTGKIKWGPFFGSIPTLLTYDLAVPASANGAACSLGKASFDGLDYPITGDACVGGPVPALSQWGLAVTALCLLIAGTLLAQRASSSQRSLLPQPAFHPPRL